MKLWSDIISKTKYDGNHLKILVVSGIHQDLLILIIKNIANLGINLIRYGFMGCVIEIIKIMRKIVKPKPLLALKTTKNTF